MRHFARFTPTIYWTTRAADDALSRERSPFRATIHAPFFPAWDDVDRLRDVILREFTISLARRHALHTPLPTAGCVIHLVCTSRVSVYTIGNVNVTRISDPHQKSRCRLSIGLIQHFTKALPLYLCLLLYSFCYVDFSIKIYLFLYLSFSVSNKDRFK